MKVRDSKPSNNKFYMTKSRGGYSTCIQGYPVDSKANVLANCVGYACGRFNEIIGSMKYPSLNCNAENFIERARSLGLSISSTPTLGGIMVWQKGNTLSGNDGAGHVAIVERINNANSIYTSESAYNGKAFFNVTRTNSNGRWGQAAGYKFRGCIINPAVKNNTPAINIPQKGDYITLDIMKVRTGAGTKYSQKRVKDLTADGKKHATSTNGNAWACYKKGTVFTALQIVRNGTEYWARTPSGYICLQQGKTIYCKKK